MPSGALRFRYGFTFGDGTEKEFALELDGETLCQRLPRSMPRPQWTGLGFFKCPNCPIEEDENPDCPAAVSLVEAVEFFRDSVSHHEVDVRVETPERTIIKRVPLQEGLSSMVGLMMATSGCPVLGMLRPMARFHLPFATEAETVYRVISMYLTAQYLRQRKGGEPEWTLKGLVGIYDAIRVVNKHFTQRLSNIRVRDASLNAVIILDCFAMSVGFSVNDDMMEDLEGVFGLYL